MLQSLMAKKKNSVCFQNTKISFSNLTKESRLDRSSSSMATRLPRRISPKIESLRVPWDSDTSEVSPSPGREKLRSFGPSGPAASSSFFCFTTFFSCTCSKKDLGSSSAFGGGRFPTWRPRSAANGSGLASDLSASFDWDFSKS